MQVRQGMVKSRLGELLSRRASQKRRDGERAPSHRSWRGHVKEV